MREKSNTSLGTGARKIREGSKYDRYFKRARGKNITVKKEALLADTVKWMKLVIAKTLGQSKQIAQFLEGESVRETCKRIWDFCFWHYQYKKDKARTEQIRTPNRSWMDRKKGIDCDCFTVTICSMLRNLNIPYVIRLTKYEAVNFEHVYPVALLPSGEEIIIDCVVHAFDMEVPYAEKKDIDMELQILNGTPDSYANEEKKIVEDERFNEFGDKVFYRKEIPIDAEDLFGNELDGFFSKEKRDARKEKRAARRDDRKEKFENFKALSLKEKLKKGVHAVNKVNPATALLRAGILASMKLNLFQVASSLRFAYWSDKEAFQKGMDLSKLNQLKRIREKLERIFFTAGGKPTSLKTAILEGKGNRNKMVQLNGLGSVVSLPSDNDNLKTILGETLYYEEIRESAALNGLGEIATGAAITAAAGVIGTIKTMITKLGSLFKKGSVSEGAFKLQRNTDNFEEKTRRFSFKNLVNKARTKVQDRRERKALQNEQVNVPEDFSDEMMDQYEVIPENDSDDTMSPSITFEDSNGQENSDAEGNPENGFVAWIKKNKVGLGIGAGVLTLGTGLLLYQNAKSKKKKSRSLNGVAKKKRAVSKAKPKRTTASRRTKKRTTKRRTTPKLKTAYLM